MPSQANFYKLENRFRVKVESIGFPLPNIKNIKKIVVLNLKYNYKVNLDLSIIMLLVSDYSSSHNKCAF
jgi:hypothetical protein